MGNSNFHLEDFDMNDDISETTSHVRNIKPPKRFEENVLNRSFLYCIVVRSCFYFRRMWFNDLNTHCIYFKGNSRQV